MLYVRKEVSQDAGRLVNGYIPWMYRLSARVNQNQGVNRIQTMMKLLPAILMVASVLGADDRHIGVIDFYGYSGLDLNAVRAALPFHEGDPLPSRKQFDEAREPFAKAIGRKRVKFSLTCCRADGRSILDVGIEEPDAPAIPFNAQPNGEAQLAPELLKLYQDHSREADKGVRQGVSGEDNSHGYRLSEYAPARAIELQILEYARTHTADLVRVLHDAASAEHRAAAAEALGYADESESQIAGLVYGSFDTNGEVRNNAIRALGELVNYDPKALKHIPLDGYVALLHSVDFMDRNKACFLVESFTKTRDAEVLRKLRDGALLPLSEIAQWKDFGHAMCAFESLGRIAGLSEQRLEELLLAENVAPILEALRVEHHQ